MTRKFFTFLCCIAASGLSQAQTWDGSSSTDWNTPANWSTNTVPVATAAVTISNTPNKPVLASNVTIASIIMNTGSAINFNGFNMTVSTSLYIYEATLNNTSVATDIVININGAGTNYIGGSTINDNITFNNNSSGPTYEGYVFGNIYAGNAAFNYGGTGPTAICYSDKSTFNGNITINRTIAGDSYIFNAGFNGVQGNFSYSNTAGGATYINTNPNVVSGPVSGTVNITATGAGNPVFQMGKIKNLTTGGTISVQNSGAVLVTNDTLKVVSMSLTGVLGSDVSLTLNSITGNFTFSEAAGNTGAVYIRGNTITGNTVYTSNSTTPWYEGYINGCTYNGNTTFNYGGTGPAAISYSDKSTFNGNLTINRTGIGITNIFNSGFNGVAGNFSYNNTAGGDTYINANGTVSGAISGTINITANGTGNPIFRLGKIKNLTTGGTISVQNSGAVLVADDTLQVVLMSLTGILGSDISLTRNSIRGNFTISEAAGNAGAVYLNGNNIGGNTVYTTNSTIPWYESYIGSNRYGGNLTVNRNGTGAFFISYSDTTVVNQSLTFNSSAGITVVVGIAFAGTSNGIFEQLGTQPIIVPRLIMNKTGGSILTLNDSVTVTASAAFINGNIYTSANKHLIFPHNISYTGGSAASHVVGPVVKIGDDIFTFPTGGPVSYNPVNMTAPTGTTSRFIAQYILQNPSSDGFNTNNKAASLTNVSKSNYWNIQRLSGTSFPTLTFGFGTNPYEQYPSLANLKVAQWSGTQWDDKGNGGTTGTAVDGTIKHTGALTAFGNFTLANLTNTYFYKYSNPGPGPDGTPVKFSALGGWTAYNTKQLPAGVYSADSIYLVANGGSGSFKLKDLYGVEKDDTTVTVAAGPTVYISANGNGSINFTGWRHFVYLKNAGNQIIGAIRDNNLTLGNTTMTAYFSTANVASAPNGNIYLKRSFKITSQFAPVGTKRVRFYITKTEFNNLQAADPTAFPNGINSLTITKYTGAQEDSLFNPIPGGNSSIIPNSDITIADLGTLYSLDIDVTGFSGFYIGGNQANVSICPGSTISLPSTVTGATYQWQVNAGSGFVNISNGAVYGAVTTKILTLTNVPGTFYGYQYRCVANGNTNSLVYTLKFTATWLGTASNVWENIANWSCGVLPDANTDVLISNGKPNYPQVGANTSIRSLKAVVGTSVTIKTGFNLTIAK